MNASYSLPVAALAAAFTFAVLVALRRVLFALLTRAVQRTESEFDDLLVAAVKGPSLVLAAALSLVLGVWLADLPAAAGYAAKGLHLSVMITVTAALANVSGRVLLTLLQRADLPVSVTSLLLAVIKAVVYIIGVLVILNYLGISIAPLVTALGVGGLAMALALQDTLTNLFAGVHILAERTIRVGDSIRLESGQEGTVEDISWRTTRIRMMPDAMVIVPNSKLAQSVVVNYHLPERELTVPIRVSVACDADVDRVEQALLEEATRAIGEVPGLLAAPGPSVRFLPGFGESSLDFTLFCRIREFGDQNIVLDELHRRILKRFRADGIAFAVPGRTVYLHGTTASGRGRVD